MIDRTMIDRTIIEVALADADLTWLEARADDLDLDLGSALRMIVRQARKAESVGVKRLISPMPDLEAERRRATELARQAEIAAKRADLQRQMDALNETAAPARRPAPHRQAPAYDEPAASEFAPDYDDGEVSDLIAEANEVIDLPRVNMSGPPGSLFVATGISSNTPRGYDKTDPRGSVMRQNYAHLGFNGG